jgi:hypothetical protein
MRAMMDWLPFHEAVEEIERALSVSRGKAEVLLRQVCSTGEIKSRKQPFLIVKGAWWQAQTPEPEIIERHEWRDHDIDVMTDSNGCHYSVDVEKSDFEDWLQRQTKRQPKKAVGKVPRILKLLDDKFKGEPVPDPAYCPRNPLKADLLKLDPLLNPLTLTTLKTAIETYNANLKRS